MKRFLILCSVGLMALGCSHDKAPDAAPSATAAAPPAASAAPDPAAAAAASAAAAAPATATAAAPVAPAVVAAIPAEEDFEPQAATTITAANASQQLTAIEKEIGN